MSTLEQKRRAAARSLDRVAPGMRLGLGSGSTAELMVELLGERVRAGLSLAATVPTSPATRRLAEKLGLPVSTLEETPHLHLTIDGADEVSPELMLIKGGGGAHLHEKLVAAASDRLLIIAEAKKRVPVLGAFPLPVEVVPVAARLVGERLRALGGVPSLRQVHGVPFRTEEQNLILDCAFGAIEDPRALAARLDATPGIVEHGLFVDLADEALFGTDAGVEVLTRTGPRAGGFHQR
jgi:ribose 5-phosphate isomerase A